MIWWFTWLQFAVAIAAGTLCLVAAFLKRKPNDLTVFSIAAVWLLLLAQLVVVLLAPGFGNPIIGDGLEFWMYLITALIIPLLAGLWSIIEREPWSNGVLAVAGFTVAVMVIRMQQIWLNAPALIGASQ